MPARDRAKRSCATGWRRGTSTDSSSSGKHRRGIMTGRVVNEERSRDRKECRSGTVQHNVRSVFPDFQVQSRSIDGYKPPTTPPFPPPPTSEIPATVLPFPSPESSAPLPSPPVPHSSHIALKGTESAPRLRRCILENERHMIFRSSSTLPNRECYLINLFTNPYT